MSPSCTQASFPTPSLNLRTNRKCSSSPTPPLRTNRLQVPVPPLYATPSASLNPQGRGSSFNIVETHLRHFRCHAHMALPSLSTSKYVPVLQSPTPTPFSITIYKRYDHEPHIARLYFQGIDDFLCYRTPRRGKFNERSGLFPESDPDSKRG